MSDDIKTIKDAEKATAEAHEARQHGRHDGHDGMGWLWGLGLIALGAVFLLNNLTGFELHNWWALFILIPGLGALGYALQAARAAGRFNQEARGSLVGAFAILFTAAVFLFGWNWGAVWPFYLIIAGLGALLAGSSD